MKKLFTILACFSALLAGCESNPVAEQFERNIESARKYASFSTGELRLRRNQIVQMLGATTNRGGSIDIKIGDPLAMALMGDDDDNQERIREYIEEKNGIERELYRRWKEGDQEAKLDIFTADL